MSFESIERALARLAGRAEIERGTPATDAEIAEYAALLGVSFPADYAEFLRTFGALRVQAPTGDIYSNVIVLGKGDGALDIRRAPAMVDAHCKDWGRERVDAGVFLQLGEGDRDLSVFDDGGAVAQLYRGTLQGRGAESFCALVESYLKAIDRTLTENAEREALVKGALAGLRRWLVPGWREEHGAIYVRNGAGIEVEVRFGDGRELHIGGGNLPGIFYAWSEPLAGRTVAEILDANRTLLFARGATHRERVRYRGRLLALDLSAEAAAFVLHHDAAVPLATEASLPPIDAARLSSFFSALSERILPPIRDAVPDGELAWRAAVDHHGTKAPVHIALAHDVVSLRARLEIGEQDAAAVEALLDGANRGRPFIDDPDRDNNLDMEKMATFSQPEPGVIEVRVCCLENALEKKRIQPFAWEIADGVRELKRALDLRDPIDEEALAAQLRAPLGPIARAIALRAAAAKNKYGTGWPEAIYSFPWIDPLPFRSKRKLVSPWGTLVPFASVVDAELSPVPLEAALVVRGGEASSDACPVVCMTIPDDDGPRDATLVAANAGAFFSLLAIGCTGTFVRDEESAAFARMRFYDYCARSDRNLAFLEWLASIGVEPAEDPLAVVEAAGAPRHGIVEVTRG